MNRHSGTRAGAAMQSVVLVAALGLACTPVSRAADRTASQVEISDRTATTTTIRFTNMPVRSALQLIAEEGHFNLVVPDTVDGTVSLKLVNVTWEQALDVVLRLKGLRMRVQGNTRSVTASGEP